jgi:hypothetical protein
MFALAAIAVGAFMAYVGATSAMAVTELEKVVLCSADQNPCQAGNVLGAGSKIHADLVAGKTFEFLSSLGNIHCTTSSSESTVEAGQSLAKGLLDKLGTKKLLENCTRNGAACTMTEINLPYKWQALLVAGDTNYHVVVTSDGNGNPGFTMVCGAFINCTFQAVEELFSYTLGTSDNVLSANISLPLTSGGLCPSTSTWQVNYLTSCLTSGGASTSCWLAMEQ